MLAEAPVEIRALVPGCRNAPFFISFATVNGLFVGGIFILIFTGIEVKQHEDR